MMNISGSPHELFARYASTGRRAGAVLRLALRPESGHYQLLSGSLRMGTRELKQPPRHYVYSNLVLIEMWLPRAAALRFLTDLAQSEELQLPRLGGMRYPKLTPIVARAWSGAKIPFMSSGWPVIYVNWVGDLSKIEQLGSNRNRVVGRSLPIFPDERTAVLHFVHGHKLSFDLTTIPPLFVSYVEDRRARIIGLDLKGKVVTVRVESQPRLVCNVLPYGAAVTHANHHAGVPIHNGHAAVALEELHDYLLIALATLAGEVLDEREVNFATGVRPRGVTLIPEETPQSRELVVRSWIDGGENERIEFKKDLSAKDNQGKGEFLETVVAFANGAGGAIILGVDNNGTVHGFKDAQFSDKLTDMVRARCDPVPEVTIEVVNIAGKPLTIVYVEGRALGTQYCLDTNKVYIRAGATDRLARRDELALLFHQPDGSNSFLA